MTKTSTPQVQKQFIIKADDWGREGRGLDTWRRFFDATLNLNLLVSVGVIAKALGKDKADSLYLRSLVEEYGIELWNHSLSHHNFTQLNPQQIGDDLQLSQQIIYDTFGVKTNLFGPPFNKINGPSAAAITSTGLFDGYYSLDGFVDEALNISLRSISTIEGGTNSLWPVRPDHVNLDFYDPAKSHLLVLQVHPFCWSSECVSRFIDALQKIRKAGYQCVTAGERISYQKAGVENAQPRPGRSLADNIRHEELVLRSVAEKNLLPDGDSRYYLRVLQHGTLEIRQFLINQGFHALPKKNEKIRLLDVGAGMGNWVAAAALLPNVEAHGIDNDQRHLPFLQERCASDKVKIKLADYGHASYPERYFSGIICNNTLNYLDIHSALTAFSKQLHVGGRIYLGMQSRFYPLRDALMHAENGNWTQAKQHLDRLVDNEGAMLGLLRPFIRYWNAQELDTYATLAGLLLQRRYIDPPGEYGSIANRKSFIGYSLTLPRATNHNGSQLNNDKFSNELAMIFQSLHRLPISKPVRKRIDFLGQVCASMVGGGRDNVLRSKRLLASYVPAFLLSTNDDQAHYFSRPLYIYLQCRLVHDASVWPVCDDVVGLQRLIPEFYRSVAEENLAQSRALCSRIRAHIETAPLSELAYWQ